MKYNLEDFSDIGNNKEEFETDIKECKKILTKITNGKGVDREEIDFLHHISESLWYKEKEIRGSW